MFLSLCPELWYHQCLHPSGTWSLHHHQAHKYSSHGGYSGLCLLCSLEKDKSYSSIIQVSTDRGTWGFRCYTTSFCYKTAWKSSSTWRRKGKWSCLLTPRLKSFSPSHELSRGGSKAAISPLVSSELGWANTPGRPRSTLFILVAAPLWR